MLKYPYLDLYTTLRFHRRNQVSPPNKTDFPASNTGNGYFHHKGSKQNVGCWVGEPMLKIIVTRIDIDCCIIIQNQERKAVKIPFKSLYWKTKTSVILNPRVQRNGFSIAKALDGRAFRDVSTTRTEGCRPARAEMGDGSQISDPLLSADQQEVIRSYLRIRGFCSAPIRGLLESDPLQSAP